MRIKAFKVVVMMVCVYFSREDVKEVKQDFLGEDTG